MASLIVEFKEFRDKFRDEAADVCDFGSRGPGRPPHHILTQTIDPAKDQRLPDLLRLFGTSPRQMTVDLGVMVARELMQRYEREGRTLDTALIDLRTPKGLRAFVSSQLNSLAAVQFVEGANAYETLWKSFGRLMVVGRRGKQNVYVAKDGVKDVELRACMDLRFGKTRAAMARNERLEQVASIAIGDMGSGRTLAEKYRETVTAIFKQLEGSAG